MTTTVSEPGLGQPDSSRSVLLERAQKLKPLLDEHRPAGEQSGELADEVADALHEGGFFGMWVPEPLGGFELDPISSLEVIQTLAEGDPSVAWVLMAAALATGTGGAYLADDAVAQVFGGDRFPVIAGQGTKPGSATVDGDGFRLSGDWQFASGIKHAQWIHTLGIVEETGDARIFVLPVEQAALEDNWDVMGLCATGSIDYHIEQLHVPEAFTHIGPTETPVRGGELFRLGIIHFALIGHSGWALGVSRRMLDELADLVQSKVGRPGSLADSSAFHSIYGGAEAKWHAARAFVHDQWRRASDVIYSGRELSVEDKTLLRLALYNATWSAEEISLAVYKAGGTTALRSGTMQHYFRDMHAGTQHVTSAPAVVEACGRSLAGLAPGHDWMYMNLIPS